MEINNWTEKNKMQLNPKKTKSMIFNFTKSCQFTTDITVKNEKVEIVDETKLLGTIITKDLNWNRNTEEIVKDANKRMRMLHAASKYTRKISDLKQIYSAFIRSKLDHSAVVWHYGLSKLNRQALERVQKSAVRIILKDKFKEYKDGLKYLNLDNLDERRNKFCLKFAKNCIRNQKLNHIFPLNKNIKRELRKTNKYQINFARTDRYMNSTIPSLQRLINNHEISRDQILRINGC